MVLASLDAGKHVYIEKPMTFAVDEGVEIIDAVQRTGRVLQVGSQGISSPIERKAREIVQQGRLGQITMVRAAYDRNSAGGAWIYPIPPDASPATINWEPFLGPASKRPFDLERFFRWRCYWDYSGGIPTDLFAHLVTSLHYVLDVTMPRTVTASGGLYRWTESREVPDTVTAVLDYPQGFTVNLGCTMNNQAGSESGMQILGTTGALILRGDTLTFVPEQVHEDNRWVVASWPEELERAYYADPKVREQESPWTWDAHLKDGRMIWRHWGLDDTAAHLADWVDAIRAKGTPVEDATFGHRAASCAHMMNRANRAIREKRIVEWDFDRDTMRT
jgi:predicted dehydrogenase